MLQNYWHVFTQFHWRALQQQIFGNVISFRTRHSKTYIRLLFFAESDRQKMRNLFRMNYSFLIICLLHPSYLNFALEIWDNILCLTHPYFTKFEVTHHHRSHSSRILRMKISTIHCVVCLYHISTGFDMRLTCIAIVAAHTSVEGEYDDDDDIDENDSLSRNNEHTLMLDTLLYYRPDDRRRRKEIVSSRMYKVAATLMDFDSPYLLESDDLLFLCM